MSASPRVSYALPEKQSRIYEVNSSDNLPGFVRPELNYGKLLDAYEYRIYFLIAGSGVNGDFHMTNQTVHEMTGINIKTIPGIYKRLIAKNAITKIKQGRPNHYRANPLKDFSIGSENGSLAEVPRHPKTDPYSKGIDTQKRISNRSENGSLIENRDPKTDHNKYKKEYKYNSSNLSSITYSSSHAQRENSSSGSEAKEPQVEKPHSQHFPVNIPRQDDLNFAVDRFSAAAPPPQIDKFSAQFKPKPWRNSQQKLDQDFCLFVGKQLPSDGSNDMHPKAKGRCYLINLERRAELEKLEGFYEDWREQRTNTGSAHESDRLLHRLELAGVRTKPVDVFERIANSNRYSPPKKGIASENGRFEISLERAQAMDFTELVRLLGDAE